MNRRVRHIFGKMKTNLYDLRRFAAACFQQQTTISDFYWIPFFLFCLPPVCYSFWALSARKAGFVESLPYFFFSPCRTLIEKDVSIPPEAFRKHVDCSLTHINRALKQMSRLFLVEDLVDSLKVKNNHHFILKLTFPTKCLPPVNCCCWSYEKTISSKQLFVIFSDAITQPENRLGALCFINKFIIVFWDEFFSHCNWVFKRYASCH